MNELYSILKEDGFKIKVRASLGITFNGHMMEKATILKSGVMIIEGTKSEKEAYDFYIKLIVNRLELPASKIDKEEDMLGVRVVVQESKK